VFAQREVFAMQGLGCLPQVSGMRGVVVIVCTLLLIIRFPLIFPYVLATLVPKGGISSQCIGLLDGCAKGTSGASDTISCRSKLRLSCSGWFGSGDSQLNRRLRETVSVARTLANLKSILQLMYVGFTRNWSCTFPPVQVGD